MSLVRTHAWGRGIITLLFAAIGGSLWGGNLVSNGSFDQSLYSANSQYGTGFGGQGVTNWTGAGYSIYFFAGTQTTVSAANQWNSTKEKLAAAPNNTLSPDGGNFVALDGDPTAGVTGSLTQSIAGLTSGASYVLSFYWAATQLQSRTGATNESVQYSLGNLAADIHNTNTVSIGSQAFTGWFKVTFTFVANNSTETLKFLAKSSSTCLPPMVLIDSVSLNYVPEPGTLTLLGVGTALILGAAIRRRRRPRG